MSTISWPTLYRISRPSTERAIKAVMPRAMDKITPKPRWRTTCLRLTRKRSDMAIIAQLPHIHKKTIKNHAARPQYRKSADKRQYNTSIITPGRGKCQNGRPEPGPIRSPHVVLFRPAGTETLRLPARGRPPCPPEHPCKAFQCSWLSRAARLLLRELPSLRSGDFPPRRAIAIDGWAPR